MSNFCPSETPPPRPRTTRRGAVLTSLAGYLVSYVQSTGYKKDQKELYFGENQQTRVNFVNSPKRQKKEKESRAAAGSNLRCFIAHIHLFSDMVVGFFSVPGGSLNPQWYLLPILSTLNTFFPAQLLYYIYCIRSSR